MCHMLNGSTQKYICTRAEVDLYMHCLPTQTQPSHKKLWIHLAKYSFLFSMHVQWFWYILNLLLLLFLNEGGEKVEKQKKEL